MRIPRILSLLFLSSVPLFAQNTEASISGIVTDTQGAVVPRVEVYAMDTATGVKTTVHTNESGFYSISPLPIGSYTLTAEISGFRRHTEQNIVLSTGQALELNIKLEIGAVAEAITVSASASQLETRSSGSNQVIESESIADIPLGDRRSMNIIEMVGGAVFA